MKVTLKNLHEATAQQVFDQVAEHLLTQKAKSRGSDSCLYQSDSGLQCAAGCLIADDEYDDSLEGKNWGTLVEYGSVPYNHYEMIQHLQWIHDESTVHLWMHDLWTYATEHGLKTDILNKFKGQNHA